MTIVFDLDNTLVDAFGSTVRPGIVALLTKLRQDGHTLVLWTNSRRDRARAILRLHDLEGHFRQCIFREDYDPEETDVPKDIRRVRGQVLIDDDPQAIEYTRSTGRRGILIQPFRKGLAPRKSELSELYAQIRKADGLLGRIFR